MNPLTFMRRLGRFCLLTLALAPGAGVAQASLFKAENFQSLTSDARARSVGDLLTVLVFETASARSSADTSAGRDAAVGLDAQGAGKSWSAGLRASNQVDGGGHTQRENRVLAQITVRIVEIAANGELRIAGEQSLEINDEKQTIALEGMVRPQDISENNVVQSNRVADARIRFQGQGELSVRQRPAWWQRLLTLFGA